MNAFRFPTAVAVCRFITFAAVLSSAAMASAQTAPKLVSVTPAVGDTNAAPHDPVVFIFDQEMSATPPIASVPPFVVGNYQFTPANVNNLFIGSWSADHKTLTFKPSSAIALNTAVTWTLNPAGATIPLTSAAGVALETTSGNYRIASNSGGNPAETCGPATAAPGIYTVSKVIQYSQTGPNVVTPQPAVAGLFATQVTSPTNGPAITNGSLTLPDGSTKSLTNIAGAFRITQSFSTESALETAYPAGAYTLKFIQNGDVQSQIAMNMPAASTTIPQIENYIEAQSIDPTKDFTLKWNAFSPASGTPIVRVIITDEFANRIFLAPNPCVPRTLDPSATSIVIPANYLKAGFSYNAQIIFAINFYSSTTDVAGMTGNGFVQRSTAFTIKVVAAGTPPSETCNLGTSTGGSYTITKNLTYRQDSAAQVIPEPSNPALFGVTIANPSAGPAVTNASLTLPNLTTQPLTNQFGFYLINKLFDSEADLNAGYPSGGYTIRFQQNGLPERVVDMAVADMPAVAPQILNYSAGQTIDASKEFTLQWNAFTPQPPGAFIRLIVSDLLGHLVFMAPNPCIPRDLSPSATSITIPTNYLSAGASYQAQLSFGVMFYNATDTNGMVGYGGVQKTTLFSLTATNGAVVTIDPARFTAYRVLANGHPEMTVSGTPNKTYTIIRTGTLLNPVWATLNPITMNSAGTAVFEDADTSLQFPAYYRAVGN